MNQHFRQAAQRHLQLACDDLVREGWPRRNIKIETSSSAPSLLSIFTKQRKKSTFLLKAFLRGRLVLKQIHEVWKSLLEWRKNALVDLGCGVNQLLLESKLRLQ
jgi:hypothetical protein